MPKDAGGSFDDADHVLLFWSEAGSAASRQQPAEIVDVGLTEAVLVSSCEIPEDTKVRLIGRDYIGDGTVRSCQREGTLYKLCVSIGTGLPPDTPSPVFDPGLFAVENFLTEEQEAQILNDLEDDDGDEISLLSNFHPNRLLGKFSALIRQGFESTPAR